MPCILNSIKVVYVAGKGPGEKSFECVARVLMRAGAPGGMERGVARAFGILRNI